MSAFGAISFHIGKISAPFIESFHLGVGWVKISDFFLPRNINRPQVFKLLLYFFTVPAELIDSGIGVDVTLLSNSNSS